MNQKNKWLSVLFAPALLWAGTVAAQIPLPNQGQPAPMVEIFGCNYTGDNGMEDLLAVTERWNRWADSQELTDYTAVVLAPIMYSEEYPFDVVWLGANPSGASFGEGLGLWLSEGGDLRAEFEAVTDCVMHSVFAEVILRQPEGPPPEAGIVAMQNCTLLEGRNIGETLGAGGRWAEWVGNSGSDVFMSQLYPFAGLAPDQNYTYKAVTGYESAEAYGQFLNTMTQNGFAGANAAVGILGPYVNCDSTRLYATNFVRIAEAL